MKPLTLDHFIPLSKGGKLLADNICLLCNECNSAKRNRPAEEFFSEEKLKLWKEYFEQVTAFKKEQSPTAYQVIAATDLRASRSFVANYHYTRKCTGISYAFNLFHGEVLIGVIVFSKPSRHNITVEGASKILELSRMVILDGTPKNTESYFLGAALRWLKANTDLDAIVTYADPTEGHTGVIYQASNFKFLGKTGENYHYETEAGERIHKRQVWDRSKIFGVSEEAQALSENLSIVWEEPKNKYAYYLTSPTKSVNL